MDCSQIKDPALLAMLLRSEQPTAKARVINCFYELYYEFWCKLVNSSLITDHNMPESRRQELISDAFSDGLCSFILFIETKGYEDRGATMETLFLEFCKRKLWGALKANKTYSSRLVSGDPDDWLAKTEAPDDGDHVALKEREILEEQQQQQWQKAWRMLGEKCRNLITWRKLKKFKNEQIAVQLHIDPGSVTNEVYRCMQRLKKNFDGLK